PAGDAVEDNAEIKFAVDAGGLFDQQPLDFLAMRPGLMRDQRHAENLLCVEFGLLAGAGHFDAAAFAAASGVDLRLDDHAASALGKELAGYRRGFFEGVSDFAARHGDAVPGQDFLRLVLVNLHGLESPRPLLWGFGTGPAVAGAGGPCQRYSNSILPAKGGANGRKVHRTTMHLRTLHSD